MKNKMIKSALLSIFTFSGVCVAGMANAFVIDNFNTGDQTFSDSNSGSNTTPTSDSLGGLSGSDVLGTVRDIQILTSITAVPPPVTIGTVNTANNSFPLGTIELQKDSRPANVDFRLDYDGTLGFSGSGVGGINPSGLGSVNFTSAPENVGIRFNILNINDLRLGSVATLTVFSDAGTVSGTSTPVDLSVLTSLDDIVFLFNNSGFTSSSVNFSTVSALRLDLTIVNTVGQPSVISFDQVEISQVPFEFSPAVGVGLLGLAWGANKLRKAKKASVK